MPWMVSNHGLTVVSVVLLLGTLVQSKNLRLRGRFDDAASARLDKPQIVRPLNAPPVFVQARQDPTAFKPPTQETCDKVAEMAKGEMTVEESTCDAVIWGGSAKATAGCECHFLGEAVKCPWAAPNSAVTQDMIDMGFNRLDNMGANAGPGSGSFKVQNCMYMAYLDPFPHTVDGAKALQKADHDDVLYMIKAVADSTEGVRKAGLGDGNFANFWSVTLGPWPVDEYGTPTCFGRCTTNPPNVWLRYTTTAAPALL